MAQAGRDKFEVVCRIAQDSIPYFSEKISFSGQYDSDEDRHTVTVANATGDEFYRATIRKLDSIDRATCFLQEHVQYQNERVMSAFADFANNFYRWRMAERPENWIRREILSNHSKFTVLVRTMRYVLIGTEAGDDGGRKTRIDDLWAADAAFFRTFGRHLALRHLIQKKYGKTEKYIMDDDDLDQHIANGFSEPATSTRDSSNVFDERPSRSHPTSPISPVPQPPRMHQTTRRPSVASDHSATSWSPRPSQSRRSSNARDTPGTPQSDIQSVHSLDSHFRSTPTRAGQSQRHHRRGSSREGYFPNDIGMRSPNGEDVFSDARPRALRGHSDRSVSGNTSTNQSIMLNGDSSGHFYFAPRDSRPGQDRHQRS